MRMALRLVRRGLHGSPARSRTHRLMAPPCAGHPPVGVSALSIFNRCGGASQRRAATCCGVLRWQVPL
jgi:hypothetical protein